MKKYHKSNKGFSLIELIIVIAIMVALVAVMAPQFIKYIEKARDASIVNAAENVLSVAKAEYSASNLSGSGLIRLAANDEGKLQITFKADAKGRNLTYTNLEAGTSGQEGFAVACGLDTSRKCASKLAYVIHVDGTVFASPVFEEDFEESK